MRSLRRAMKRSGYSLFLSLSILTLSALAQHSQPASTLSPDPALLKKHVTRLASDEFEGRRPGTAGADKAARYIADRFHEYGLGCATAESKCNKQAAFLKEFPFIASVQLGKNNTLNISL